MTDREEIIKKIRADNLVMSSVPIKTKEEFVAFAREEFADNYGACLKYIFDFFKLSVTFLEGFDGKMDKILASVSNQKEEIETEVESKIKTISGKQLKGGKSK